MNSILCAMYQFLVEWDYFEKYDQAQFDLKVNKDNNKFTHYTEVNILRI
jgi:hypothetical protein